MSTICECSIYEHAECMRTLNKRKKEYHLNRKHLCSNIKAGRRDNHIVCSKNTILFHSMFAIKRLETLNIRYYTKMSLLKLFSSARIFTQFWSFCLC